MNINDKKKNITNCLQKFHSIDRIEPKRLVMTPIRICYICDKDNKTTYSKYIDSYLSLHHFGYQYCGKCGCLIDIFKNQCEEKGFYIPNKKFKKKKLNNLRFFRVSSNPEILPYIHHTSWININEHPIITLLEKKLYSIICWNEDGEKNENAETYIQKRILLSNIIFYNRTIFGYSQEEGILKVCSSYWKKALKKTYDSANIPLIFITCIDRKYKNYNIDNLIKSHIIEYWKGDLL